MRNAKCKWDMRWLQQLQFVPFQLFPHWIMQFFSWLHFFFSAVGNVLFELDLIFLFWDSCFLCLWYFNCLNGKARKNFVLSFFTIPDICFIKILLNLFKYSFSLASILDKIIQHNKSFLFKCSHWLDTRLSISFHCE